MAETRPYRPSNGTEGEGFIDRMCAECVHLGKRADRGCAILARAFAYDLGHEKYPAEWVIDVGDVRGDTARCTARKVADRG